MNPYNRLNQPTAVAYLDHLWRELLESSSETFGKFSEQFTILILTDLGGK